MMTEIKRIEHIVIDYIRRYWWTFFVGGTLQVYAGYLLTNYQYFTSIGFIFGAGFLLGFEILRGDKSITRTLLTLPVSASELSSIWRILGLLLPIVFYFTTFSIGLLWTDGEESNYLIFSNISIYLFIQFGILGLIFYSLTGVVEYRGSSNMSAMTVKGVFFTFLWCSMLVGSALCGLLIRWKTSAGASEEPEVYIITWLVLFIVTIAGFFRADILVANRYLLLNVEEPVAEIDEDENDSEKTWRGIGDLRYLIGGTSALMFAGFFALVSASWVFVNLLEARDRFNSHMSFGDQVQMNLILPFIGLAVILQVLPILRPLRTLPVKLDSLSSLLIFWPFCLMAALAGSCMAVNSVINGISMNWENYLFSITGGAITLFFVPFVLRFGANFFTLVVSVSFTIFTSLFVNVTLRTNRWTDLEAHFNLSLLLLIILILTWGLSHLVLRSSHPWKSGHFSSGFGGSRSPR